MSTQFVKIISISVRWILNRQQLRHIYDADIGYSLEDQLVAIDERKRWPETIREIRAL